MQGRLEHAKKRQKAIKCLIKDTPKYVQEYCYSLMATKEPTTTEGYVREILNFLKYINEDIKTIDITNVTRTDIDKYLIFRSVKIKNGEEVRSSFAYQKRIVAVIKNFFEYLLDTDIIRKNPAENLSPKTGKDDVKRYHLTSEDLQQILRAVDRGTGNEIAHKKQEHWNTRDKAILALFINTGMRLSALTEINIDEVDLESHQLTIIDKRSKIHHYELTESLEKILKNWLNDRNIKLEGKPCDALFISNRKVRIHPFSVRSLVEKYVEEGIGIKLSPHKIRAGVCTLLYETTGDIKFVADFIGHANVATTQRYIVNNGKAKKTGAELINKAVFNS